MDRCVFVLNGVTLKSAGKEIVMIDTPCPHCGIVLSIPERFIGQQGRCKHCDGVFTVQPPTFDERPSGNQELQSEEDWYTRVNLLLKKHSMFVLLILLPLLSLIIAMICFKWSGPLIAQLPQDFFGGCEALIYQDSTKPEAGFQLPRFGKQIVTFAHYTKIQNGMSYEQVTNIIGSQGEEVSQNHMDGVPGVMKSITTVMYQWMNENGSGMNAIFQNNKLVQKAQFGLS